MSFLGSVYTFTCESCVGDPWYDPSCAACGRPAAVVLAANPHQMPLCRKCEGDILLCRTHTQRHTPDVALTPLVYLRGQPGIVPEPDRATAKATAEARRRRKLDRDRERRRTRRNAAGSPAA